MCNFLALCWHKTDVYDSSFKILYCSRAFLIDGMSSGVNAKTVHTQVSRVSIAAAVISGNDHQRRNVFGEV